MSRVHEREEGFISLYDYMAYDDFSMPVVDTITSTEYPAQDAEYLYTEVPLWYMDERTHETLRGVFTVIRWDAVEPHRVILMSDDPDLIIVSGDDKVVDTGEGITDEDGNKVNNPYVHKIPIQWDELLGVETTDEFVKDDVKNKGIILRADRDSDHPQVVIMETDAEGNIRFITGEDCRAVMIASEPEAKTYNNIESAMEYMTEYWPALEDIIGR